MTAVTWGSALISATSVLMRRPIAGSVSRALPEVPNTTSSVSPEWAGATDLSRLMASADSVWGKLKLSEYAVPTCCTMRTEPTRTSSHNRTTMRR